ncbi:MAG: hypothetical protein ABJA66_16255 [Actinomycetota bacterium]
MKKVTLFLLVVFCLGLVGCNKDAEFEAFIGENHAVIDDIVKKIDANPTEAGVDEAQKSFDAKKAGLKTKWDAIKEARGVQVSEAVTKKLTDSMTSDMKMLTDVQQKNSQKLAENGEAMNKFVKLVQSYSEIIK